MRGDITLQSPSKKKKEKIKNKKMIDYFLKTKENATRNQPETKP